MCPPHTHIYTYYRGSYMEVQRMFHSFIQQQIPNTCQAPASDMDPSLTKPTARWGRQTHTSQAQYSDMRVLLERSTEYREVCRGRTLIPAMSGKEFGKRSLKDGDQPRRDDNSIISLLIKNVNEILPSNPRGCYLAFLDYVNK